MKLSMLFKSIKSFTYADGDVNSPPPPAAPPAVPPPPPTMFTQEQVNAMMAKDKVALKQKNEELITQLNQLKESATLTTQQKADLEARIEQLSQQHLTKEQQLAAELDKTSKKAKTEKEAAEAEAKKWQTQFNNSLVTNELLKAAETHKAANAEQLLMMFSGQAKVVEILDDAGKPTGQYTVKMPIREIDAKTKLPVTIELDAKEAIGKIRENPQFSNLFLFEGVPGTGGNNNKRPANGELDLSQIKDPAAYRVARAAQNKKV